MVVCQVRVPLLRMDIGQVGSVSLVYQHLVVTCHLLLDSIQRFLESCPKSWVFLVELY